MQTDSCSNVGDVEKHFIEALKPERKEDFHFVNYQSCPTVNDPAALEEWIERLKYIKQDLHRLLRLPHERLLMALL